MPRYSRRLGPAANFELLATPQAVPGLSITRQWDEGELLILARVLILNGTAGTIGISFAILIDGVQIPQDVAQGQITAGNPSAFSDHALIPISGGIHTIHLVCTGSAVAGDVVLANGAILTVIQLPQWDQPDDIT